MSANPRNNYGEAKEAIKMGLHNNCNDSQTTEIVIGKCKYIVTTHYKENGRETAEDKLFRLVSDRVSAKLRLANS